MKKQLKPKPETSREKKMRLALEYCILWAESDMRLWDGSELAKKIQWRRNIILKALR